MIIWCKGLEKAQGREMEDVEKRRLEENSEQGKEIDEL